MENCLDQNNSDKKMMNNEHYRRERVPMVESI